MKNCSYVISNVSLHKKYNYSTYSASYTLPINFPQIYLENRADYSENSKSSRQLYRYREFHSDWISETNSYTSEGSQSSYQQYACPSEYGANRDVYEELEYAVSRQSQHCDPREFIPESFDYNAGY